VHGHYLCYAPERLETSDALRRFREWMLDESARGDAHRDYAHHHGKGAARHRTAARA